MRALGFVSVAVIAFLVAVVMFLGDEYVPEGLWHTLIHEIGFALMVSVLIWVLFELRRTQIQDQEWDERIKRIAENVFFAVLRKDMPKGVINEANMIGLSSSFLRQNFNVVYTFRDHTFNVSPNAPSECVLVSAVVSFRISNISPEPEDFHACIGLPNPVHPELKKLVMVHSLVLSRDGAAISTTIDADTARKTFASNLELGDITQIVYSAGTVSLAPDSAVEFRAEYVMAKEGEDTELLQTLYPSDGLTVTVTDQAAEPKRLVFARSVHRVNLENQSSASSPGTKIFRVPGYLLPHQGMLIWWKRVPPNPGVNPPRQGNA